MKDRSDLPAEFVARMEARLGKEADDFFAALADPPDGLRVNTLRTSPEGFEAISPFVLRGLGFPPEGYLLDSGARPGKHPYHSAGLYYLQDPSAMVVGALVGARPGERVLDLSAAPGGKSTHLAAAMRNTGVLIANDVSRSRAGELVGNLERCGVINALVTSLTGDRLASHFGGYFDRVLLDAPCSGESMFHKSRAALADWSPRAVVGCARRQDDLLETAARLVRPGGLLVYSTCTFSEEENEAVVAGFLERQPEFAPAALPPVRGAEPVRSGRHDRGGEGRSTTIGLVPGWDAQDGGSDAGAGSYADVAPHADVRAETDRGPAPGGASEDGDYAGPSTPIRPEPEPALAGAYRLWPHRVPGAGHFIAALRRSSDADPAPPADARPSTVRPTSRPSRRTVMDFVASVYDAPDLLKESSLVEIGSEILALPAEETELACLPAVRSGLRVGTMLRGRFEPAHALVMAIPPRLAWAALDLRSDDPRVEMYLAGHPVESPGPPGWIPISVDGFALGWGKRVGSQVKNHYPKGLRRR